jgi:hypothetical protein
MRKVLSGLSKPIAAFATTAETSDQPRAPQWLERGQEHVWEMDYKQQGKTENLFTNGNQIPSTSPAKAY